MISGTTQHLHNCIYKMHAAWASLVHLKLSMWTDAKLRHVKLVDAGLSVSVAPP